MLNTRGLLAALVFFTSAGSALAAEITEVADAADHIRIGDYQTPNPFDLWIGPVFEFRSSHGMLTREPDGSCLESGPGDCDPTEELSWARSSSLVNLKMQIGIFHDLAITVGLPVVLSNTLKFDYAESMRPEDSSVDSGAEDTRLFANDYKSGHSGLGDVALGLRFAPLSDIRDESKPTWVLFVKWTSDLLEDPYLAGKDGGESANGKSDLKVTDGVNRLSVGTSLSKRVGWFGLIGIDESLYRRGYLEPYMEFSYTLPTPKQGVADRAQLYLKNTNEFGMAPSHTAKVHAGLEIVPNENIKNQQKFAYNLGFVGEYFSEGRNTSLLTDPLGELTYTGQFFDMSGLFSVEWRPNANLRLILGGSLGYRTEHFVTNENIGRDGDDDGIVDDLEEDQFNPYFCGNEESDFCSTQGLLANQSYDQIGFRFKDASHVFWSVFSSFTITL